MKSQAFYFNSILFNVDFIITYEFGEYINIYRIIIIII
jgi:hypothetical protein